MDGGDETQQSSKSPDDDDDDVEMRREIETRLPHPMPNRPTGSSVTKLVRGGVVGTHPNGDGYDIVDAGEAIRQREKMHCLLMTR